MSKRAVVLDDKLLSEMTLKNIGMASKINLDMSSVFNAQQMQLMNTYKQVYNYQPHLTFFLSVGMMSHFSQNSYFTHYSSSDHRPIQLYLWLLGPSGSGKTHAFRQMEKAIMKTEKIFPNTYLKPVMVNGKPTESDLSSIITHTNHIGLRQHLASSNKILLNDDADLIAESYGLYNVNDTTKEHERNLILCGYDGFNNASRTTGATMICIGDKRLTIVLAITGGKLMKNMKNWYNATGYDGSHNRFLYMAIPKVTHSRPQDFNPTGNTKGNSSFAHLCVIVHLFGTVRYVFQMSESERVKFCDAKFDERKPQEAEQTQTQQERSAMFTVWNLIADLVESTDQKENEQQQIVDFYAKAGATFPRLACLMQMYFNATDILEQVKDTITFAEGDNNDIVINENFIDRVKEIIKDQYYFYDTTYIPSIEKDQMGQDPLVIVQKDAVVTAWKWYEYHLNIATTLFTIDPDFTGNTISRFSSKSTQQKTIKQLIMSIDFNIFPLSTITDKHPVTGQTGIIKNRPAMGETALQELMAANLIKFNYFLLDVRGRSVKSYMKTPIPLKDDPTREEVLKKLKEHGINIVDYCATYEKSSIPPGNTLSSLALSDFKAIASLVPEYSKYEEQLQDAIQQLIDDGNIRRLTTGIFFVVNHAVFVRKFNLINNIIPGEKPDHEKQQSQRVLKQVTVNQTTRSTIELETTTAAAMAAADVRGENVLETVDQYFEPQPTDQDFFFDNNILSNAGISTNTNLSATTASDVMSTIEEVQDENSMESRSIGNETEQTKLEVTTMYTKGTEQAVKKAMKNIMTGKSVIYTKTDLSQICNKTPIRLEALKQLVDSKLLQHGKNYWVEQNRAKKEPKKESKQILREGWLKKGPDSDTTAAKFQFLQLLQENVGLSYEEYINSFYYDSTENVFTGNNWTLSDEVVRLFNSNFFYKEHVRWNVQRFRPTDVLQEAKEKDDVQPPLTQMSRLPCLKKVAINDIQQEIPQEESNYDSEGGNVTEIDARSTFTRPKRKAAFSQEIFGHQNNTHARMGKQIKYTNR